MRRDIRGKAAVVAFALLLGGIGMLLGGLAQSGCNPSNSSGNGIVTKRKDSTASESEKRDVEKVTDAEAQQARKQIELSIRAHGGDDNLARMRNFLVAHQFGRSEVQGQSIPTEREWQIAFPERINGTVTLANQAPWVVWCNDSGGWLHRGGETNPLGEDMLKDLRNHLYVFWLLTLRPLRNEEFVLKSLPDTTVQGRPAKAIKVMRKDQLQVELDFDAQTNLLVRIFLRPKLPEVGTLVDRQILLSAHKTFEGIQLPTHWTEAHDGQVIMDFDKADYRFPLSISAKVFQKPE
jgi:hypothetical protein